MPVPPNPPAEHLLHLAARAMGSGRFEAAENHLRAALAHDPANPTALHHLALRLWLRGEIAPARHLLEQAATAAPNDPTILTSYATMLHELAQPRPALDTFLRVLALDPSQPEIWNAAGICLQETAQPAQAIEFYLRALRLRPNFAEAHSNLGAVLTKEGDLDAALDQLQQAVALDPTLADAHHNLGIAHRARFEYTAALASLRQAQRLQPNHADILAALGELLSLLAEPQAEPTLRHALALRPDDPEKHWNLALELLQRGDYPAGWREYEGRWQRPTNQRPQRPFPQPAWRGQPIQGQTLLLFAEQGLGDTLQFLRYIPSVLALGARIILEVQRPLRRLAETFAAHLSPSITVIAEGDPLPAFNAHCPLMSLPFAFASTIDTLPPPLRLTPATTRHNPTQPLRIGLAWAGNPKHQRDRERSIPPAALLPLFDIPGCTWFSLQTGAAANHLDTAAIALAKPPLHDFTDTATLLDTLDLVLTVDSAIAHLAAMQAIPTWIMLPYITDWRWNRPPALPGGATGNPWYPQARLFRQPTLPDGRPQTHLWTPVIADVARALQMFSASHLEQSTP